MLASALSIIPSLSNGQIWGRQVDQRREYIPLPYQPGGKNHLSDMETHPPLSDGGARKSLVVGLKTQGSDAFTSAGGTYEFALDLCVPAGVEAEAKVCRHVDGPGWTCSY